MVRNIAFRVGNIGAKETFFIDPFRSDWFVRFSIEHDLDCTRVRAKNPNLDVITDPVRAQHAEWIRMKASHKSVDFVAWNTGYLESFHYRVKIIRLLREAKT